MSLSIKFPGVRSAAWVVLLSVPTAVQAHSAIKGVGDFYAGLLHPLAVSAHLIAIIATALLCGQRGWTFVVHGLPVFILATVGGLFIATKAVESTAHWILLSTAVLSGLIVVLNLRGPDFAGLILIALTGFVVAIDSPTDVADRAHQIKTLSGSALGAAMLFSWVAAPVARIPSGSAQIGIRIAGSWLAASAVLVLALGLRSVAS